MCSVVFLCSSRHGLKLFADILVYTARYIDQIYIAEMNTKRMFLYPMLFTFLYYISIYLVIFYLLINFFFFFFIFYFCFKMQDLLFRQSDIAVNVDTEQNASTCLFHVHFCKQMLSLE
jgi:hypothetical protein